ncbi:MAG: GMC family oxidoreductase [Gammaproteobacteria bacterium]|nr:GMC family oxidoreductase [Gammaproteobacteria bacterium]
MSKDYDVCVVGSGAGAGPVISELSRQGKSVLVLEKGPWLTEEDFTKDEMACCRRSTYTPKLEDEQHVLEEETSSGNWLSEPTSESGWDFWNGNVVGGASNFMSGYFYRIKPKDFRLLSEFGPIKGANVADWPISYEDMEPYFTKVETEVGISGKVIPHKHQEPRSTKDFPFPPTSEHPVVNTIDKACDELNITSLPTPRAILSKPSNGRNSCEYSGYCGSYGCHSGAKGSSRAALLDGAVLTGNCEIRSSSKVYKLKSNSKGQIVEALYYDADGKAQSVSAKIFVVACHAIETSRLLFASDGPKHPNGLGNNYSQLGKNLLFSAGGTGTGEFHYSEMDKLTASAMKTRGPFVNRGVQDWYYFNDKKFGGDAKGGVIDFLLRHPNPISKAMSVKWNDNDNLNWGHNLKRDLKTVFTESQDLRFEVFNDWLPTDNCFVSLDNNIRDKWGSAVAKVRLGYHEHDLKVGEYLSAKAENILQQMGAKNIRSSVSGSPPANLVAGGCRFGNDIKTSVLDKDCKVHDVDNLYVTDGSFMPTGGSVPYTWTIYANSFRVADIIKKRV